MTQRLDITKGLKRTWIVAAVMWVLFLPGYEIWRLYETHGSLAGVIFQFHYFDFLDLKYVAYLVLPPLITFVLGVAGIWVSRGFSGGRP